MTALLIVLLVAIFVPGVMPSLINVGLSVLLGYKLAGPTWLRIGVAIAFSALLSLGVRIPSLLAGDPSEVRSTIVAKTLVGPREKVRIEGSTEEFFYRTRSDPPSFGVNSSLHWGFLPLTTVVEYPQGILTGAGIASTTSEESRIVARIGIAERDGILEVKVVVLDGGKVVATYAQRVRKSYPFEDFDGYGFFAPGDWRPIALYLTQDTFWAPRHQFAAHGSHPLKDFLLGALGQGAGANGNLVPRVVEVLEGSGKLRIVEARFASEPVAGASIPGNTYYCKRDDAGHPFDVIAPEHRIRWGVSGVPGIDLGSSVVGGRPLISWTVYCGEPRNTFWFASYDSGRVNLWKYRVEFDERAAHVESWLQAEVPPGMRAVFDFPTRQRLQIARIDANSAELYLGDVVNVLSSRAPDKAYRIDIPLARAFE